MTSIPSALNISSIADGVGKWCFPVSMPFRLTTRCAGTGGFAAPAAFMAHPTIRADNRVPANSAMAPYELTLPLGIILTMR